MRGAIGIFAKTIGLSPVKTRLASKIGVELAEQFYALSIKAVEDIVFKSQSIPQNDLEPYWVLAEEEAVGCEQWESFTNLWTGEGDLGMRLHRVYSFLRQKHDYVILIGTDSPQLEPKVLTSAIIKLQQKLDTCVIGPALDGGFYLFAASVPIIENIWTKVSYSQSTTLRELKNNLNQYQISIELLPFQIDIDVTEDLLILLENLKAKQSMLLPSQNILYRWLQDQINMIS